MGRKPMLDREMLDDITKCISNGLTQKDTCYIVGIDESSLCKWVKRGHEDMENDTESIYVELVQDLKKAEAKFKLYHLQKITTASSNDWKASAWMLERKYPREYGRIDRGQLLFNNFENTGNARIVIQNDVPDPQDDDDDEQ